MYGWFDNSEPSVTNPEDTDFNTRLVYVSEAKITRDEDSDRLVESLFCGESAIFKPWIKQRVLLIRHYEMRRI